MNVSVKITLISLIFLLIVVSGIWLTRTGKPYNPVLFNVHKFVSLTGVVVTAVLLYGYFNSMEVSPLIVALTIAAGLLFVVLLVSGGLLNLDIKLYKLLRIVHRITPALSIILTALIFLLLLKK